MNKMTDKKEPKQSVILAVFLILVLMVWAVFGQTLSFGFINCDDNVFVYENPLVLNGFTGAGVAQALTRISDTFYYPFTVISFMLDSELYGMNPGGFHLTNVLLHSVSVLFLFFLLRRLTGSLWRSAVVAAVFAIHPLQVEAVAWVTARKDVLSGLFFMLALHAYVSYVRIFRAVGTVTGGRWQVAGGRYLLTFFLFAMGLISKPMLVTFPFVLLLLDCWPLKRWNVGRRDCWNNGRKEDLAAKNPKERKKENPVDPVTLPKRKWYFFVFEKIPFFLLSAVFCVTSFLASSSTAGGSPVRQPDFLWRTGNAIVSYAAYIHQAVFPAGLAMPYPEGELHVWQIAVSSLFLMAVSVAAFLLRNKRPCLLVGWLWFTGMLVPVSGVVRFIGVARADRFVYLPIIGLLVAICFAFPVERFKARSGAFSSCFRLGGSVFLTGIVLCWAVVAYIQAGYWKNNLTLWTRAVDQTGGSALAYINLGASLYRKGAGAAAEECFLKALEIAPDDQQALYNLGYCLIHRRKVDDGITCFRALLALNPDRFDVNKTLGAVLILQGKIDDGIRYTRRALAVRPNDLEARDNLEIAEALLKKKREEQ